MGDDRSEQSAVVKGLTWHGADLFELTLTRENLDAMINTVGNWLETRGVDPFSIHREVFFNASH